MTVNPASELDLARLGAGVRAELAAVAKRQSPPIQRLMVCFGVPLDNHLAPERPPFLPMLLPALIRGAIDGDPGRATPVAAAATLLFLSFDLLDDLQDGDNRAWWAPLTTAELLLLAATLPATLPAQLLCLPDTAPRLAADLGKALSTGLLAVAEGQAVDLSTRKASVGTDDAEAAVLGKSGAQMALYARLAALHAGASPSEAENWAALAHGLGCAGQFGSDVLDLLDPDWSRDLASGTRTLPLAFTLAQAQGHEKSELEALLARSRTDRAAQKDVVSAVQAAGGIHYTAFRQQVHITRARAALDRLAPAEPWRRMLRWLLTGASGPDLKTA